MENSARMALALSIIMLMVTAATAEEVKKESLVEKLRKKVRQVKTQAEPAKTKAGPSQTKAEPSKVKAEPAKAKEPAEPDQSAGPEKAAKPEGEKKEAVPVARTVKDMSRGDMVSAVKGTLDSFDDILGLVPGLKAVKTEKGETSYTYEGVKIEDLEDAKLKGLFSMVRQHATRINAERINRQLMIADRARGLAAAGTKVPTPPPTIQTQPAVAPPPTPVGPPKVPKPPPAPPRVTR
jgi:hypothetical protein